MKFNKHQHDVNIAVFISSRKIEKGLFWQEKIQISFLPPVFKISEENKINKLNILNILIISIVFYILT